MTLTMQIDCEVVHVTLAGSTGFGKLVLDALVARIIVKIGDGCPVWWYVQHR